jgi:hypothetical protein
MIGYDGHMTAKVIYLTPYLLPGLKITILVATGTEQHFLNETSLKQQFAEY